MLQGSDIAQLLLDFLDLCFGALTIIAVVSTKPEMVAPPLLVQMSQNTASLPLWKQTRPGIIRVIQHYSVWNCPVVVSERATIKAYT